MIDRFAKLPSSLAEHARTVRLGARAQIPALLIHPDWIGPAPTVIWLHGRTANKELDAGRYVRWLKNGIAACAIDLPAHGERADARSSSNQHTLEILAETIPEIDQVTSSLAEPIYQGVFDPDRLAIGGMSLGGMATLRRLCDPHTFRAACVECTTGDLNALYNPPQSDRLSLPQGDERPARQPNERVRPLDPAQHLATFAPIPLLALHSEADRVVPWSIQHAFLNRLRTHYQSRGSSADLVRIATWPTTGAPGEHSGFGRVGNDAKNLQTDFLAQQLLSAGS